MAPVQSGASSLPRGFRYDNFKTPEPQIDAMDDDDRNDASLPRPRLRIKRRVASVSLAAPTQQFLASVAAADLPIPSIEEPELHDDELMHDTTYPVTHSIGDLCGANIFEHPRGRGGISPPKTPAPCTVPSLSPLRYPNWSIDSVFSSSESSPECDSRPSTSRSTQTSASAFSSRFSLASDDPRCASPAKQQDRAEPFPSLATQSWAPSEPAALGEAPRSAVPKPRRVPWTKAMTDHLWATYNLYLQDPKVTPFAINKAGVPPLGVCIRVAREAKRSWKGSKFQTSGVLGERFAQWPRTHAATRTYLRELCKRRAGGGSQVRGVRALASTPAAPGRMPARHRNRAAAAAARSPSVFGNDMSVSLALSTAESMQPHGPLAQLTSSSLARPRSPLSSPPPLPSFSFPAAPAPVPVEALREQATGALRLGSPFTARGHGHGPGPGPATDDPDAIMSVPGLEPTTARHANAGPRRSLQSPVKISHSRSKSAVHKAAPQKARSRAATNDPRKSRRPSMSELFSAEALAQMPKLERPSRPAPASPMMMTTPVGIPRHFSDDSEVPYTPANARGLFRPRALTTMAEQSPGPVANTNLGAVGAGGSRHQLRLGSPFMANTSFSFPGPGRPNHHGSQLGISRLAGHGESSGLKRPDDDILSSGNQTSRLAYVDLRLRELRQGHPRRQFESPY